MADLKQAPAADPAAANGQGPAPAPEECKECATASERVMGIAGLLFAVGLAAIAIDLITGGALSRLAVGVLGSAADKVDGGQPGAG